MIREGKDASGRKCWFVGDRYFYTRAKAEAAVAAYTRQSKPGPARTRAHATAKASYAKPEHTATGTRVGPPDWLVQEWAAQRASEAAKDAPGAMVYQAFTFNMKGARAAYTSPTLVGLARALPEGREFDAIKRGPKGGTIEDCRPLSSDDRAWWASRFDEDPEDSYGQGD